jgi:hypothetical protein
LGDVLEFGCYEGASTERIIKSLASSSRFFLDESTNLWVFDSFEGLPILQSIGDKHPAFEAFTQGEYRATQSLVRTRAIKAGISADKLKIIPGFYDHSLKNLPETPKHVKLVHIDVDLYSSCCEVLKFIEPLLQDGSLIVFDDYFCYRGNPMYGVARALAEWKMSGRIQLTEYTNFGWSGKVFIYHA